MTSILLQDQADSADSNGSSAAEIPQSSTTELITIGSEDGQEPSPEVLVESMSAWQAGRAEEGAGEEVKKKSSFPRFRRKTQHLKGQSSNGWFPLYGSGRGVKHPSSRGEEQTSPSLFLIPYCLMVKTNQAEWTIN